MIRKEALALLALGLSAGSAQALTVTATDDANTLADTLLGSGVTITSVDYSGADEASGTFSGGSSSGIGIESGIILTTGSAELAVGPNGDDGAGTDNGLSGFTDGGGDGAFDASILTISFTTATGDLYFNYVWASDEYNEYVNTDYNDKFFFLLNGSDPLTNNIAFITGTTTPVEIDTVNLNVNSSYYNNNDLQDGGPFFNIEYDGFTDVFTASATGLATGGVIHTIMLIVEDTGDEILDSAVFIQGGSFSGEKPVDPVNPVPLPAGMPLLLAALGGLGLLRSRKGGS